jgi:mono/diheme cytochrome c family protein
MMKRLITMLALAAGALMMGTQNNADARGGYSSSSKPAAAAVSGTAGASNSVMTPGRALFLRNCAQCHGADAHGDDGPDLHGLDSSDEWIANRIRNGKKGQMTAFAGKLQPADIDALIAYLHTLK